MRGTLRQKRRAALGLALSGALGACAAPGGSDLELASARLAQHADSSALLGLVTTEFGGAAADRCVEDVSAQFANLPEAPTGKVRYLSQGGNRLPPSNARLADFSSWDAHVQSIARISVGWGDSRFAAISRSNPGHPGGAGVFLIYLGGVRGADGTRWTLPGESFGGEPPPERSTYWYQPIAGTDHAGGLQAVGDVLVLASEGAEGQAPFVDLFRLRRSFDDVSYEPLQRFTLSGDLGEPIAPSRFITAAALAPLEDGRQLLFVLGKDEDQQGWFYLSDPAPLSADTSWSFLGHTGMPGWYQNVNLVTDCASGGLYLIATGNPSFDGSPGSGIESADLLAFNADGEQLDVTLQSARIFSAGRDGYCTFRAAANAFVDAQGQLLLYCHAYKANTDVLGRADSKLKLVEYAAP